MRGWIKKGIASLIALSLVVGGSPASAYTATPPQWPNGQHPRWFYDGDDENYSMNSTVYWYLDGQLDQYFHYLGIPMGPGYSIEYAKKACRLIDQSGNFIGAAENLAQEFFWQQKQNDPAMYNIGRWSQYWMLLGAVYYVCPDQWGLVPANMRQ